MSLRVSECRFPAARVPLWAAHCFRRIMVPNKKVALQHARRCGLCVAFVAYATPWPQVQVLGSVGADGVSSANPPTPNAE